MSDAPIRSKLKPTISASALDNHRRCARRTYYQYVARVWVEQTETLPMAIGKTVHTALKDFFASPTDQRSFAELSNGLRAAWKTNNMRRFFVDRDDERRQGLGLLETMERFHGREDVTVAPIGLEQKVELPIGGRVALFGYVDRIDATPDGIEITDYKTGRPFADDELPDETALMVYAAATRAQYDLPVVRARVINLQDGSEAHWDLEEEDVDATRDRLAELLLDMHRDNEWHATPGPACRTCRWASVCDQRTT